MPLQVHPVSALRPWGPCPRFVVGSMAGGAGRRRAGGAERGAETSPLGQCHFCPQLHGHPPDSSVDTWVGHWRVCSTPSSMEAPEGRVVLCFIPQDPSPLERDHEKQAPPVRGGEGWSGGSR